MSQSAADAVNSAGRNAVKQVLRSYGEMTAVLRGGPSFVVIGAKRGGTTSLYRYLLEHPSVAPLFPGALHMKRPRYYDVNYARGLRWYRSHFPLMVGDRSVARPWVKPLIAGEASPYYLFHPLVAERLARDFPDVRLIVILRDPVERAYSHYKERRKHNAEPLSFEEALAAEQERLRGEAERIIREPGYRSLEHEDHSYLAQGRYLEMLERWFTFFPKSQFHIAVSEEFYADPGRVVNDIWSFLDLPQHELLSRTRHNYIPAPGIQPTTRQCLQDAFAEHNGKLECLIGRSLPWNGIENEARGNVG
jgi:Sulfotransferase domain